MSTTILLSMRVFLVEVLNCVTHCAYCFDSPSNCPWGLQDVGFGFADDFMVTLIIVLQDLNKCVLQIQTKQVSPFYRTHKVPLWNVPVFSFTWKQVIKPILGMIIFLDCHCQKEKQSKNSELLEQMLLQ